MTLEFSVGEPKREPMCTSDEGLGNGVALSSRRWERDKTDDRDDTLPRRDGRPKKVRTEEDRAPNVDTENKDTYKGEDR